MLFGNVKDGRALAHFGNTIDVARSVEFRRVPLWRKSHTFGNLKQALGGK